MARPETTDDQTPRAWTDAEIAEIARKAFDAGMIRFFTDFKRLNRQGSPVYDPWENVLPLLLLILGALGVLLFLGVVWGLMALIGALVLYVVAVRPWIAHRLRQRAARTMLADAAQWDRVWRVGGIAVVLARMPSVGAIAPRDNWRGFVRDQLAGAVADLDQAGETAEAPATGDAPPKPAPEILAPDQPVAAREEPRRRRRRRSRRDDGGDER